MVQKKEEIEVHTEDLVEEVHARIDALLELLEEKGLITEREYLSKLEEIMSDYLEN